MLRVVLGRAWTHATHNISTDGQVEFRREPDSMEKRQPSSSSGTVMVISRAANSDSNVTSSIWSETIVV